MVLVVKEIKSNNDVRVYDFLTNPLGETYFLVRIGDMWIWKDSSLYQPSEQVHFYVVSNNYVNNLPPNSTLGVYGVKKEGVNTNFLFHLAEVNWMWDSSNNYTAYS